jgi:hypothetical protein
MSHLHFMNSIRFQSPIENFPGFRADAVVDDTVFEVLVQPKDARRLRTALLEMARVASTDKTRRVVLVLEEPAITESRLREEWKGAASVLRPDLLARLSIAVRQSGKWTGIPVPPVPGQLSILDEILRHELSQKPVSARRRPEAHYEILRILIHQWLLGKGPLAIRSLMAISGTSHPTVSRSLERLDHYLKRHSDRSVELRIFPREEWARLLAVSDDVRGTVRFVDHSGQARSPESLLRRLRQLQRQDIAVGGVLGAKHYQPSFDLVGNPRLDLSIHSGRKAVDLSFVERLDPALEQATRRDASPTLVVHCIRRAESLFQSGESGLVWADPLECLLDLHEARLESQALEFLNSFPATKGRPL